MLWTSELDILLLGAVFPPYCSVTAKRSLRWIPFLGEFSLSPFPRPLPYALLTPYGIVWASKTVFIDRANAASARQTFDSAAQTIRSERQSVYIFPEGTRSYSTSPMLLPFKKGAFHLAVQAQVPVVPIACQNYTHVLVMKGGWKKWRFESGVIRVKVLRRIETAGLGPEVVDGIAKEVREGMLSTIEELAQALTSQNPIAMKSNGKAQ